jgi:positive regulator of sigma E activity
MRETGRVIEVEREKIVLALESDTACTACEFAEMGGGAAGCPACGLFSQGGTKTLDAVNPRHFPLAVGDRVTVFLAPGKTVVAAFFFFVLPLVLFIFGYGAAAFIWPASAEAVKTIAGAGGFIAACVIAGLRGILRRKRDWPEVIEKRMPNRPLI